MIINPQVGEGLDGTVMRICLSVETDKVIVPITRINSFKFNEELLNVKEAVIFDFIEYGWDRDLEETHLFGVNTDKFLDLFRGEEWLKFDNWVKGLDKKIYFKRELVKNDIKSISTYPIDYPCWFEVPQPVSKEEYDNRPLQVLNYWGRSHEARLIFHGNIWLNASAKGYDVCDNINYLTPFLQNENEGNGRRWATFNIPHYSRRDIKELLSINSISKITVAMPGAGLKTFRGTGEAPYNSAVLMKEDSLSYSYDWINGINCVKFYNYGEEIQTIEAALNNPNLYEIYKNSVETCRKYQIDNYVNNYLLPIINRL